MPGPIYGALRLNSPAVALPATPEQIAGTDQLLQDLTPYMEEVRNTTRSSLQAEKNSVAGHPLTRASTIAPIVAGIINETIDIKDNWNTPGFNRGQNIFALALWVTAGVYFIFVIWKHHQQIASTKTKEQNQSQAKALLALKFYLDKSNLMVQACLNPNMQNFLPEAFAQFRTFTLKQAKAGAAPNDLVMAWAGAGVIINLPVGDPGHANLGNFIQTYIAPLMTDYTDQVKTGLANLGLTLPANGQAAPAPQAIVPAPPPANAPVPPAPHVIAGDPPPEGENEVVVHVNE